MFLIRVVLLNILFMSQIFALSFNQVRGLPVSAFAEQFTKIRAEYIRLFDSFLKAYGEHDITGQFPDYSFTEAQFARYQSQFVNDFLSQEKSIAYQNFKDQIGESIITIVDPGQPALWKHYIQEVCINLQILEQYNDFIIHQRQFTGEANDTFFAMNQAYEIAQCLEQSMNGWPMIFNSWCEDLVLFMTHGTRYSFDSFRKDINNDVFFKGLKSVTCKVNLLEKPQYISSIMPLFIIERAKTTNQQEQLNDLISTFKTIAHRQGIPSVVEFNDLQMANFFGALKAGEYTCGPDDIIGFTGPFNLTISQMRFLKGYEQVGYVKNKQQIHNELIGVFSKDENAFKGYLDLSKSDEYMVCSGEDYFALREAVFDSASHKKYQKNLATLIEDNSGKNIEFDRVMLTKIHERKVAQIEQKKKLEAAKRQEEKELEKYYESIKPKKGKKSNNSHKRNKVAVKKDPIVKKKENKPILPATKVEPKASKPPAQKVSKNKKKKKKRQKYMPEPITNIPTTTTVLSGYDLKPYDGPTDDELRRAQAYTSNSHKKLERESSSNDGIVDNKTLRSAQRLSGFLNRQFGFSEELGASKDWGEEQKRYQELRKHWEENAQYKQRYRIICDFYDDLEMFDEYESLLKKLHAQVKLMLRYCAGDEKIPPELFLEIYKMSKSAFKEWEHAIKRLEVGYPVKLDNYFNALLNPHYERLQIGHDDEEDEESSSIEIILRDNI